MARTTPFHSRLEPLNETGVWKHWSGILVAPQYQYSLNSEYYAVRNSAGLFDTSPLFKYRIQGPDATQFLSGVLARDIRKQIRNVFGNKVFKTTITRSVRLEESPAYKKSIFTFAPSSSGAVEYYSLSEEVIGRV